MLTAKPETVKNRVSGNQNRPLLKNRETVEAIRDLMERRRPSYENAADFIISTDGRTLDEICSELTERLQDHE